MKKLIGAKNLPTNQEDDESDESSDSDDDEDPSNDDVKPEDDQKEPNDDETNHQCQIAKDEIIPDAVLEAERTKYERHTRSRGPAPEHPLVHKNLLERKRKVGFQNEIHFLG